MSTKCPCGGETYIDHHGRWGTDYKPLYTVYCEDCGAQGPACRNEGAADAAWCLLIGKPAPLVIELAVGRLDVPPQDPNGFETLAKHINVIPECVDQYLAGQAPTGGARSRLIRLLVK